MFLSLTACLDQQRERTPVGKLEAVEAWLESRGEATISVGVIASEASRQCSVQAHGETFVAYRNGSDFAASWSAIVAALALCETFESRYLPGPGPVSESG